jgi:hypothetical protein
VTIPSFAESFQVIDALLADPAPELVRVFYQRDAARQYSGKSDFVGELFTTIGSTHPDTFEADDLLAVHLMGMNFTATATTALLTPGPERDVTSNLLATIPTTVEIWEDEADLSDSSSANELWQRLVHEKGTYSGVNWVTAGKLLARKRPRLIPIVDSVVTALIPSRDERYWALFQNYLRTPGAVDRVESLRPEGMSRSATPTLRLLDTAIWMRGSKGPAKMIREELGLPA